MQMTTTPLLDMIENMDELRRLPEGELQRLAAELRDATIGAVSKTGGHLGAGLGVVELTVALHYVFQTPHDRLIWDVGHLDRGLMVRCMSLPDRMIDHDSQGGQLAHVGFDATGIAAALRTMPGLDAAGAAPSSQKKTSS